MLRRFYKWRYHRRARRRSRMIFDCTALDGEDNPPTIFKYNSVYQTRKDRLQVQRRKKRILWQTFAAFCALLLLWLLYESVKGIGIFTG